MLSTRDASILRLQLMAARYKARLGERIREAREAKGLTQAQLARLLPGSVDGSQVSRWERGQVQPQPDNLEALAVALEVDPAYFLAAPPADAAGDPLGVLADGTQLDRIEAKLDAIAAALLDGASQPDALTRMRQAFEGLSRPAAADAPPAPRTATRARR